LELLDGLSVISHRISILKGFLSAVDEEGYVQAQVQGLTNTLRWKHKVCVNLPGVDKPYGEDIRGCLIAPEGYVLVGSDMSSLEDRTKQHYMWDFDPAYVKEMMTDDFDPHLDLCVAGGMLTDDQVRDHKEGVQDFSSARKLGKAANYACVYGAGGATVARSAGISELEGNRLVEAYWKRNWSVEAIAASQVVKTCRRQKWLYNPVSRLWYSLRHEKDRFSTLNQGTGVWCFDTWVKYVRQGGLPLVGQFHDEVCGVLKEENKDRANNLLRKAIDQTNEELKLNRELDIDIQFGLTYADIH
jgi:DNA polymerase I-like protein with 3'-5' exonuclease and polymerase domains